MVPLVVGDEALAFLNALRQLGGLGCRFAFLLNLPPVLELHRRRIVERHDGGLGRGVLSDRSSGGWRRGDGRGGVPLGRAGNHGTDEQE